VSDLKISELPQLAGANLAANDLLAVADTSASETRSITISDGIGKAVTLIADDTIPSAKVLFAAGSVPGSAIEGETVNTSQLANDAVNAAKLANNSVTRLASTLPVTGDFTGQFALDTDDLKLYCWDGSTWQAIKAGGSVNTVIGGSAGVVNITVTQTGDSVTLNTTLDNTGAASQFLAGPTSGAGSVTYRVIAPADLPTATTTEKGAVLVNGNGLAMSGNQIVIDNTVTQNTGTYHVVSYNAKGLITDGRALIGADVPVATSGTVGVVAPGAGLGVNAAGTISHTNTVTPGTYEKVTVDAQGHVTAGGNLVSADLTDIEFSASQLTSGTINAARFAANSIEGTKLSNNAVTKIGGAGSTNGVVVFPTPDYNGQYFYDSLNGDLYLYDGNAWQPITITAGEIIFAGTFSANPTYNGGAGKILTLTSAGTALGLTVNSALPLASGTNSRYYFVVSEGGTPTTGNAPLIALAPPDIVLSDGTAWTHVDVSSTVVAANASNVTTTAISGLTGSNVQDMLSSLNSVKANRAGDTFTGNVTLNNVSLVFDTSGSFNTTLTSAANNGADRTITIPAQAGTMLVSGNASIVDADISASAEVAVSKLANGTARQLLQTDAAGTAVEWTSNVDIPGTLDVTGAAVFDSTVSATGAATAARFIPTSSTVPSNGMYLAATNNLSFAVNSTKRFLIDANGKSFFETRTDLNGGGVVMRSGTSSAFSALEFTFGDIAFGNYCSIEAVTGDLSTSNVLLNIHGAGIRFNSSGSYDVQVNTSGELLVGYTTDNGAYKLQVNSQIFATSSTIATSDGRYKENVATLGGCLDIVKALRPVSFTWKPQQDIYGLDDAGKNKLLREKHNFPAGTQVGFVAQEVQTVLKNKPWLGSIIKENKRAAVLDEKGKELVPEEQFYGIAEGNLIAVLTSALQEAVKRIENLESKLANL
jgi:hypothetical protein